MTIAEATEKMQHIVADAAEKFKNYGFDTKIDTDYYNYAFDNAKKPEKAKYISVVLKLDEKDCNRLHFSAFQLAMAVEIKSRQVTEEELEKSKKEFDAMIDETVEFLEGYENKCEGLKVLEKKATEDFERTLKKMQEEYEKNRKTSMIGNIAFIVGLAILLVVAIVRSLYGS